MLGRASSRPGGPGARETARLLRSLLELAPGDTVLELDCGSGELTRELALDVAPDGLAIGVDRSSAPLRRAQRRAASDHRPLRYLRSEPSGRGSREPRIPVADATVDAVACDAILGRRRDPSGLLDELLRVLRPGGRVALLLPALPVVPLLGGALDGARALTGVDAPLDVPARLRERGLADVRRRRFAAAVLVDARLPRPVRPGDDDPVVAPNPREAP